MNNVFEELLGDAPEQVDATDAKEATGVEDESTERWDAVRFVENITQRQLEAWGKEYRSISEEDYDGEGMTRLEIASAYCRAATRAGLMVFPEWKTDDDVFDSPPSWCLAVMASFDDLYGELTAIPKN